MAESVHQTAEGGVQVVVIIDPDEPRLMEYTAAFPARLGSTRLIALGDRLGFTGSLNRIAPQFWGDHPILGAFGDDVLFRTPGWDLVLEETLAAPGIAYGDDLIHGKNHPSAVFMSSSIAKALGWLALPATSHQWADDGWKRLGQELGCLRFMDGCVFEHLHPAVDKAAWDETYTSVFDSDRAKSDYEGFTGWVESGGLLADAERVRAALAGIAA